MFFSMVLQLMHFLRTIFIARPAKLKRQHKARLQSVQAIQESLAHLLPQCTHPLLEAHSLVCPIFHQQSLCPQLQAWVSVLPDDIKVRNHNATYSSGSIIPTLLEDCTDAF